MNHRFIFLIPALISAASYTNLSFHNDHGFLRAYKFITKPISVITITNLLIPFYVIYFLYLEFTKDKIEVTLVMPLLDHNLNLKGIMASDLGTDLNKFVVKTDQNISMILLAD